MSEWPFWYRLNNLHRIKFIDYNNLVLVEQHFRTNLHDFNKMQNSLLDINMKLLKKKKKKKEKRILDKKFENICAILIS